jgi:hypothetical protein
MDVKPLRHVLRTLIHQKHGRAGGKVIVQVAAEAKVETQKFLGYEIAPRDTRDSFTCLRYDGLSF